MILVTAATGQVGSVVVGELSRRNIAARAMSRDPGRARETPGITWVAGAFDEPASMDAALEGGRRHVPCLCRGARAGRSRDRGGRRGAAQTACGMS